MSYKLLFDEMTGKPRGVQRLADGACIPLAVGNSDFQTFLGWNAEQPTPLNLDEVNRSVLGFQEAQELRQTQKLLDFQENLPSWIVVSNRIDAISSLAEARAVLKKLARVVYWLAKGKQD